jgi:hypothetical protein
MQDYNTISLQHILSCQVTGIPTLKRTHDPLTLNLGTDCKGMIHLT